MIHWVIFLGWSHFEWCIYQVSCSVCVHIRVGINMSSEFLTLGVLKCFKIFILLHWRVFRKAERLEIWDLNERNHVAGILQTKADLVFLCLPKTVITKIIQRFYIFFYCLWMFWSRWAWEWEFLLVWYFNGTGFLISSGTELALSISIR